MKRGQTSDEVDNDISEFGWRTVRAGVRIDYVVMAPPSARIDYVVMGNDFPDAVFSTEAAAEKYCERRREEGEKQLTPKIYWRVYSFTVRDDSEQN